MVETKSEAFHRLARQRIDRVLDGIRIFSNLAGPSYSWAPTEVDGYLREILDGVREARLRFEDTRAWRDAGGLPDQEGEESAASPELEPAHVEPPDEEEHVLKERHRKRTIAEIIREAHGDPEPLAAVIAMQRDVISKLKGGVE